MSLLASQVAAAAKKNLNFLKLKKLPLLFEIKKKSKKKNHGKILKFFFWIFFREIFFGDFFWGDFFTIFFHENAERSVAFGEYWKFTHYFPGLIGFFCTLFLGTIMSLLASQVAAAARSPDGDSDKERPGGNYVVDPWLLHPTVRTLCSGCCYQQQQQYSNQPITEEDM
jgi:hypothetical protein